MGTAGFKTTFNKGVAGKSFFYIIMRVTSNTILMDQSAINRSLSRIAHEILERDRQFAVATINQYC